MRQGSAQQKGLPGHSPRYQEVTQTGGKTCPKAPGFGRDKGRSSKHGEMLSAVPLPAPSMTRARAAHDHFRMQGQKRAESEARREAMASSLRNGLKWEQASRQVNDQIYLRLQKPHLIFRDCLPGPCQELRVTGKTNSIHTESPRVLKGWVRVLPTSNM